MTERAGPRRPAAATGKPRSSQIDRRGFGLGVAALSSLPRGAISAETPTLSARVMGEGREIVFVHGWTIDHRDEARTYEPIFSGRRGWRRHYVDLPGMGASPARAGIRDLDGMLQTLLDYIDRRVAGPFAIAGTSAGGYLARGVIARRSDRVAGALLRVPLVVPEDAKRDVDAIAPLVQDPQVMAALPVRERTVLGDLLVQTPEYAEAMRRKHNEAIAPAQTAADMAFLSAIRRDPRRYRLSFDPDAAIGQFTRPSLIVTGRQDASVGFRDAWPLTRVFTRSTFVVLDRAEHGLPVDQQGVFAALVTDWLTRMAAEPFDR